MTRQSAPPLTGIALLVHDCGLTPQQVMAAIEDNRANVTARMRSYGHPDAVEEVMCDLMEQTLTALRRWRNYEDRRPSPRSSTTSSRPHARNGWTAAGPSTAWA